MNTAVESSGMFALPLRLLLRTPVLHDLPSRLVAFGVAGPRQDGSRWRRNRRYFSTRPSPRLWRYGRRAWSVERR